MSARDLSNLPLINKPLPPAPPQKSIYILSSITQIENIFEILQPIGEGAFGVIYKALDKRTGDFVAIKILPREQDYYGGNFDDDIKYWQQLNSSLIVNYKETYIIEDNLWIIMDYCVGSILGMMEVSGNLNEEQIQVVMKELLLSLKYLHSKNVLVHYIKAGNVMINNAIKYNIEKLINGYIRQHCLLHQCWIPPELIPFFIVFYRDNTGTIKLADAALNKFAYRHSGTVGTPYWLGPEVFGRAQWISKHSDVWSLGITAIEMATGKPPHAEKAPLQVIFLIPHSPPPTLPADEKWSVGFRHFLSLCLTKDPDQRADVEMLLHHEWILNAPPVYMLNDWIINAIPLLDALRKEHMPDPDSPSNIYYGPDNDYYGFSDGYDDEYAYDKVKPEIVFIHNPIVWDKILIYGYCNIDNIFNPPIEIINLIISYYGGITNLHNKIICIKVADGYVFDSEFCNTLSQHTIERNTVLTFVWNELVPKDNHVILTVWENNFKSAGYKIRRGDKRISFSYSIFSMWEDNGWDYNPTGLKDEYVHDKVKPEIVFIHNPIVWDKILICGYCNIDNILNPPIEIINLIISYYGGVTNLADKIISIKVADDYIFDSEFCNTLSQHTIERNTVLTFIWNELVPKDNHVILMIWKNNFRSTGYKINYGDKTITFAYSIKSMWEDNALLDVDFAIPADASKSKLQQLRDKINTLYDEDVVALEQFYDRQLVMLDKKLSSM